MPIIFQDTTWPNILELKHIKQVYPVKDISTGKWTDKVVLEDVNLLIEDKPGVGQFIVILGESGCGKSTLLRYIAGIQQPTSGDVLINEHARTDKDVIGMVFQQYSSFEYYSVLKNVMLPFLLKGVDKERAQKEAMEMIKVVGLDGHESKYAKQPELSGGQLQRVAIARSLIACSLSEYKDSPIILMDEPFGALDSRTRTKMQQLLADIWLRYSNMTVIFVTHDVMEAVFLADDIYIMRKGGSFDKQFHIDLPNYRDQETLKSPYFQEMFWTIRGEVIK